MTKVETIGKRKGVESIFSCLYAHEREKERERELYIDIQTDIYSYINIYMFTDI